MCDPGEAKLVSTPPTFSPRCKCGGFFYFYHYTLEQRMRPPGSDLPRGFHRALIRAAAPEFNRSILSVKPHARGVVERLSCHSRFAPRSSSVTTSRALGLTAISAGS